MERKTTLLEDGFVRFDGLFPRTEINDWRRIAHATLDGLDAGHRERFRSNGSLCNVAELPAFAPLIADARIMGAIAELGGADLCHGLPDGHADGERVPASYPGLASSRP